MDKMWSVYIQASGPEHINTPTVARVLSRHGLGGSATPRGHGHRSVRLVVDRKAPSKDSAYARVLATAQDFLGPEWVVEVDTHTPDEGNRRIAEG
jgi:hypothetical protein